VTAEQCEDLIAGRYDFLKQPENPLFMDFYAKIRFQNLRPKNIVEYRREAYVYPAGNVRITFDSRIGTSNSVTGFLDPGLAMMPAAGGMVMEIKYSGFLPDVIREITRAVSRNQIEFSKYVAARIV
jgi:hypothetical protein